MCGIICLDIIYDFGETLILRIQAERIFSRRIFLPVAIIADNPCIKEWNILNNYRVVVRSEKEAPHFDIGLVCYCDDCVLKKLSHM